MKKILIVSSLYYPNIIGGAEKSTQVIAENLKKYDCEPVVLTIADHEKVEYINGVKVHYIGPSNVYWSYYSKTRNSLLNMVWHMISLYNPLILKKFANILKEEKPDIVHTNNLSEFGVGIWKLVKKNKIPLVHTLRDFSLMCPRATLFRRNDICRKKNPICSLTLMFRRSFSKYVDVVTGNSKFILGLHVREGFFSGAKKYVVYNSLEFAKTGNRQPGQGGLRFGYIGHLSQHKGIEFLLKIFKEKIDSELFVFGKGITPEYEEHLKENYTTGKIKFQGFVKTEDALKMVDVLIVPSLWYDPLPRVIYEAYSAGIPVIGSDRGGSPEIIEEGRTGFVYNAASADELVTKIENFIRKPSLADEMKPYCLEKAGDFSPEYVIKKYMDIYEDISGKR
jgi:glycosyltransferase involved in cell wall biosynthesis